MLFDLQMHPLKSMEIDAKSKNDDKGRWIDSAAEGRYLCPAAPHLLEEKYLFDEVSKRAGDGKKYNGKR